MNNHEKITKDKSKELLRKGGLFVVNDYDFDNGNSNLSYWFVVKSDFQGMDELSSITRSLINILILRLLIKNC